jgi:integrase
VAIDKAAAEVYPVATAATRNRQVYTPIIAVLRRAGIKADFERPIGWKSPKSVSWLEPQQAFAVLAAADQHDPEFGLFLRLLLYTGMRLGEAISIKLSYVELDAKRIYLPKTKNADARRVHLTPELVVALANHPRGLGRPGRASVPLSHQRAAAHLALVRARPGRRDVAAAPARIPSIPPHLGNLDAALRWA